MVMWWLGGESHYHAGKLIEPDGSNLPEVRERLLEVEIPGRWRRFNRMHSSELHRGPFHPHRRMEITQKLLKWTSSVRMLDVIDRRRAGSGRIQSHNRLSLDSAKDYLRDADRLHTYLPPREHLQYPLAELSRIISRHGRNPVTSGRLFEKAMSLSVARLAYHHEDHGFMAVPRPGKPTGEIKLGLLHGPLPEAAPPAPSPEPQLEVMAGQPAEQAG
jgi:hypothetical protein